MLSAAQHPVVNVTIADGAYRFQLETGSWANTISADAAARLKLVVNGAGEVMIPKLELGGAVFEGLHATVTPHGPRGADGQLGLPAFADLLLIARGPDGRVELRKGALPPADGKRVLPLTPIGPLWGVPITIGAERYLGFIDTQGASAIAIAPQVAANLKFSSPLVVTGRARGPIIGDVAVSTGRLADEVAIGAVRASTPIVTSFPVDLRFEGMGIWLGSPLLAQFDMTLDQRHRRIQLERPAGDTIPTPNPIRDFPFDLGRAEGGVMRVATVRAGATDLLRPGDIIRKADGRAAETLTPSAWNELIARREPVSFEAERDGRRFEVQIAAVTLVE